MDVQGRVLVTTMECASAVDCLCAAVPRRGLVSRGLVFRLGPSPLQYLAVYESF